MRRPTGEDVLIAALLGLTVLLMAWLIYISVQVGGPP